MSSGDVTLYSYGTSPNKRDVSIIDAPVTFNRTGSAYIAVYKILYPVAKLPVRQIWETDCTHEHTCNEHGPVATNKERT